MEKLKFNFFAKAVIAIVITVACVSPCFAYSEVETQTAGIKYYGAAPNGKANTVKTEKNNTRKKTGNDYTYLDDFIEIMEKIGSVPNLTGKKLENEYKKNYDAWRDGEAYFDLTVYNGKLVPDWTIGCIFPYSSYYYLTEDDLAGLTADELKKGRNEIYARHGRIFKDSALKKHFNSLPWYVELFDDVPDTDLSDIEQKNVYFILEHEKNGNTATTKTPKTTKTSTSTTSGQTFKKDWYKTNAVFKGDNGSDLTIVWYDNGYFNIEIDGIVEYSFLSSDANQKDSYVTYKDTDGDGAISYYPALNKIKLTSKKNPKHKGEYVAK